MNILYQIPSEAKIKRELKKVVFGKTLFCPYCGSRQIKKYEKRYYCKLCRKPFSFTSVTWLKGMKLPLRTFWLLLWCWTNKVPVDQAMKVSGVSEPTARRWYEKFRNHLPKEPLENIRLSGIVQMDEAYRGGKNKGFSIVAAKEKQGKSQKRRKMVIKIIPKSSVDRKDAVDFLSQSVIPSSKLHTDGASIYKGISNWWPVHHQYEIHKKWEFALTSEIEGLFGNLTTFIRRMYHHITKDKIREVVQEFTARSVYPEWFASPYSYLEIAVSPLARPKKPEWRGQYQNKKKRFKIHTLQTLIYPVVSLPKPVNLVPY